MTAKEARQLADSGKRLAHVFSEIAIAAGRGESSVKCHILCIDEAELIRLGYQCRAEIDCDSNYRGHWISW